MAQVDIKTAGRTELGLIGASDHKVVGRSFVLLGLIGLVTASVLAAVGAVSSSASTGVAGTETLIQVWSLSRELVLFGGIVPVFLGIAIYVVPLQIGSPSVAFPRGAAGALWTWLVGAILLILAVFVNGGPGGDGTRQVLLWAVALGMAVLGLLWAMLIVATTVLAARTKGMTLERVPFTSWSALIFSLVGLVALPALLAELVLAYIRVRFGHLLVDDSWMLTAVDDGVNTATSIYWPGVMVLGIAADVVGVHSGVPVKLHRMLLALIGLFGALSFAPDLVGFASLRPIDFGNGVLVLILVMSPLVVLGALGIIGLSFRSGKFVLRVPTFGVLVGGALVLLAAVVSLLSLIAPLNNFALEYLPSGFSSDTTLILTGTTFYEGVRVLMAGASVLTIIAALNHWSTKMWGQRLPRPVEMLGALLVAGGAVVWAAGEVLAGVADQAAVPELVNSGAEPAGIYSLAAIGSVILAAGVAVAIFGVVTALMGSKPSGSASDPWAGETLEWAISSPPPPGNFRDAPVVTSATPLADHELTYEGDNDDALDDDTAEVPALVGGQND